MKARQFQRPGTTAKFWHIILGRRNWREFDFSWNLGQQVGNAEIFKAYIYPAPKCQTLISKNALKISKARGAQMCQFGIKKCNIEKFQKNFFCSYHIKSNCAARLLTHIPGRSPNSSPKIALKTYVASEPGRVNLKLTN